MYMKFALKIGSFFCKVTVGYKMKIKGVIKNLKIKQQKMMVVKIYLGISLGVGSVQFQIVPCSSLHFFSRSIGPIQCANYRVLICCTCHFQSCFLVFVYFGFFCLQVFSVSNFCPDTRGQRWSLI